MRRTNEPMLFPGAWYQPEAYYSANERDKPAAWALQTSRRADAEQFAHQHTQIMGHRLHQIPFRDFDLTTQPGSSRSSGLAYVSKSSFRKFTALALQPLA